MNSRYTNLFRYFFASLDLGFLNMGHILLIYTLNRIWEGNDQAYMIYFMVTNIAWLSSGYVTGLYLNDRLLNFMRYAKRSVKAFLLFFTIVLTFLFIYHFEYSRLFIILSLGLWGVMLLISRVFFIWGSDYLHDKERYNKKIIVLGYNDLAKKLVNYFNVNNERMLMEGYFEEYDKVHELSLYPILGKPEDCIAYAVHHQITEIYSTISPEHNPAIYRLVNIAEKNLIRFKFIPDFHLFINRNVYLDYVQEIPILSLRPEPLEDIANRIKKRLFDIIFSSFMIIGILSWLGIILALMVKLSSKGPIFFIQLRSGKNNQQFKCYKFRSLRLNTESNTRQVTKNDDRYTKIGKLLRKTNLDELPQFWNVLKGNMSIVGPRPHMLSHTESFSKLINKYMIRQFLKPGITGWAQVKGFRGEIVEDEQLRQRVNHDIWYMENWSLWLDLHIIFSTLFVMIKGDKHAY